MPPVTVFGTANFANAARVMACLEEVGVEYDVVEVDYMAKEHKGAEHLARNVCNLVLVSLFTASVISYLLYMFPPLLAPLPRFPHRQSFACRVAVWFKLFYMEYTC